MTKKKYFRSIQPDFFLKKTIKDINKGVLFGAFLAILSYFFYGKILMSAFLLVLVAIYDFGNKKMKKEGVFLWGGIFFVFFCCVLISKIIKAIFYFSDHIKRTGYIAPDTSNKFESIFSFLHNSSILFWVLLSVSIVNMFLGMIDKNEKTGGEKFRQGLFIMINVSVLELVSSAFISLSR